MPPLEIQVLVAVDDVMVAVAAARPVDMAATSEPASGSDRAKAAIASPAATRGSTRRFCSSEPNRETAPEPSPCMAKAKSARPPAWARCSRARQSERTSSSPPSAPGAASFSQPSSPSRRTSARQVASTSASSSESSRRPAHRPPAGRPARGARPRRRARRDRSDRPSSSSPVKQSETGEGDRCRRRGAWWRGRQAPARCCWAGAPPPSRPLRGAPPPPPSSRSGEELEAPISRRHHLPSNAGRALAAKAR